MKNDEIDAENDLPNLQKINVYFCWRYEKSFQVKINVFQIQKYDSH